MLYKSSVKGQLCDSLPYYCTDSTLWFVAGLCRPESKEESYDYYPNDDEADYDDEKDDTYSGLPPVMKSKPLALEVYPGETVALPCATLNMSMTVC
jgi:hypothetical protein